MTIDNDGPRPQSSTEAELPGRKEREREVTT